MEIFEDPAWQMSLGERAALEGLLIQLKPSLCLSIGGRDAIGLRHLAARSDELHIFGPLSQEGEIVLTNGVVTNEGDSRAALPDKLAAFAAASCNVDLAVVEGDDSTGVREDIENLLNSPAIGTTIILVRDATSETIRAGLELIRYGAWHKVARVNLDFVPGYLCRKEQSRDEIRGGLGLIATDSSRADVGSPIVDDESHYSVSALYATARDHLNSPGISSGRADTVDNSERVANLLHHIAELEGEISSVMAASAYHENLWKSLQSSISWRVTAPLRIFAARARR